MATTKKKTNTATKPSGKTQSTAVSPATSVYTPRRLRLSKKQANNKSKLVKRTIPLPSIWRLSRQTLRMLWTYRKLFIGLTIIYGLLNILLVQGLAGGTDVTTVKQEFTSAFQGNFGQIGAGLAVFAELVSTAGNSSSDTAGAYQVFLVLIASLAIIWALRQTHAGVTIRIRDAYYKGIYPLVPFILVLCVIGLQLLPLVVGASLYNIVITNGIAVTGIEHLLWGGLAIILAFMSLYFISSSLFALYIVTLPDMTPFKALRSARKLIKYRRWIVLRKLLALPVLLFVAAAIIMVPIILVITPVAQFAFFILTMFALVVVHTYVYGLYRELLNE